MHAVRRLAAAFARWSARRPRGPEPIVDSFVGVLGGEYVWRRRKARKATAGRSISSRWATAWSSSGRNRKKRTAGGIVLPDTAKDKPARGKVVSVGDGRLLENGKRVPLQVKAGDRVVFSSYAGDEFKLGERNCCSCARKTSWRFSTDRSP